MFKKISVIGAGQVGSTTAFILAQKKLCNEIVLIDVVEGTAQGKALDIMQCNSLLDFETKIIGSNDYSLIKDSEIVVVTAGLARSPTMTREELLNKNAGIIKSVCEKIKIFAPNSVLIMITNPLDVMTWLAWKTTGFETKKIIGQAGVLDSARLKTFIGIETKESASEIKALVLGGHGDSMLALKNEIKVNGKKASDLINENKLNEIIKRTVNGGGEIVELLKTGSAYYAPAASVVKMIELIEKENDEVIACSVYCTGEFGLQDIFIGVPVKLCKNGVKEIVEIKLNESELNALHNSAEKYKKIIESLKI